MLSPRAVAPSVSEPSASLQAHCLSGKRLSGPQRISGQRLSCLSCRIWPAPLIQAASVPSASKLSAFKPSASNPTASDPRYHLWVCTEPGLEPLSPPGTPYSLSQPSTSEPSLAIWAQRLWAQRFQALRANPAPPSRCFHNILDRGNRETMYDRKNKCYLVRDCRIYWICMKCIHNLYKQVLPGTYFQSRYLQRAKDSFTPCFRHFRCLSSAVSLAPSSHKQRTSTISPQPANLLFGE